MKRVFILALLLVITAALFIESRPVWHDETRNLLGTTVQIKFYVSRDKMPWVADKVFGEINRIEKLLSNYRPETEIAFINQNAALQAISVSDEVFRLISRSIEFSKFTNGAFDITLGGIDRLTLDENENSVRFSDSSIQLDLGGIAKGYAVDRAVRVLRENGVWRGLVNAGGDLYCFGDGPSGRGWRIGIEDPALKKGYTGRVILKDQAIATSGTYRRDGHIIDPATGNPVENNILAASVIAPDCTTADALATALFIMGKEEGFRLIETWEGVEAVIIENIDDRSVIRHTSGVRLR